MPEKNKGGRPHLSGANQREILAALDDHTYQTTDWVAAATGLPIKETRRVLNDLHTRGLLTRRRMSDGRTWEYRLTNPLDA